MPARRPLDEGTPAPSATWLVLIETGERLIAERGVNGVSLREIGASAEQRNTGAVRYHFGSKQGLVDAIFEHRMGPINERRGALLAASDAAGRGHDLDALAEAFVYPLADVLGTARRPSWYLRFAVQAGWLRLIATNPPAGDAAAAGLDIVRSRVLAALEGLGVPESLRADRWMRFAGYLTHALADREHLLQHGGAEVLVARDVQLPDLVDTAVALVAAPVSATTRAHLDAAPRSARAPKNHS